MMPMMVQALDHALHARACDAIVADLPAWFGNAEGIAECSAAVRAHDGLVAVAGGEVVGFLTFQRPTAGAGEITWMAVRADRRGAGVGTELVARLDSVVRGDTETLFVKTLSDRDGDPGPEYAATRAFYLARGFRPMAELDICGPGNPCQLLGRRLTSARR